MSNEKEVEFRNLQIDYNEAVAEVIQAIIEESGIPYTEGIKEAHKHLTELLWKFNEFYNQ